jgi:V-type H+-transporting ATPase subunit d
LGNLYPDQQRVLIGASNLDALRDGVRGTDNYKDLLRDAPDP